MAGILIKFPVHLGGGLDIPANFSGHSKELVHTFRPCPLKLLVATKDYWKIATCIKINLHLLFYEQTDQQQKKWWNHPPSLQHLVLHTELEKINHQTIIFVSIIIVCDGSKVTAHAHLKALQLAITMVFWSSELVTLWEVAVRITQCWSLLLSPPPPRAPQN